MLTNYYDIVSGVTLLMVCPVHLIIFVVQYNNTLEAPRTRDEPEY